MKKLLSLSILACLYLFQISRAHAAHEIQITNFAFAPQELQISVGDSVRWTNLDGSPHTVTATDNSFDSGNLGSGQSFTRVFTTAGSFPYVCAYHSNMTGVIHVGQSGGSDTTWHELPSPTALPLNDIRFVSDELGWIAGDQGILRTTDGGDHWALAVTPEDMEAVYFINATEGWACGNNGAVLHSTNGGQNWSAQVSGEVEKLRDIWFADANNGWAVGRDGILIHTNDGGQNWSPQSSPATDDLRGVHMLDIQRGWAVGSRGLILYTENGGLNWNTQLSSPNGEEDDFEAIFALNADTAWVSGGQGRIFVTFNGGSNWTPQASGATTVLNDIHFAYADEGLTAGAGGYIAHGMAAGGMWHTLQPPAFVSFNGVWVQNSSRQFVVCGDGRIFRRGDGTSSGIDDQLPVQANFFLLHANYPNPFNPSTTIEFTMSRQAAAHLEVFDILGRSVRTLVDGQIGAGLHRIQFSGADLSSGKYFFRLESEGHAQTRIMTLMK